MRLAAFPYCRDVLIRPMNYRQAFHAGNFADVFKQAILLALLDALTTKGKPLCRFDTHTVRGRACHRGRLVPSSRHPDGPFPRTIGATTCKSQRFQSFCAHCSRGW